MKPTFGVRVLVAICLFAYAAAAQQLIANGGSYSENFDAIGTANFTLTDNTAPFLGYYTLRSTGNVAPKPFTASTGTSNTSQFYSFGNSANANRALGFVNANGVTSSLGLRLQNNGAATISSIRIRFAFEQWRDGNGSAETAGVAYQVGPSMTSLSTGTWTSVPAFDWTAPNAPGGSGNWNGDLAANRTAFDQTITVNIPVGQEIMIRWASTGNSGQGDGLGVDDIIVDAIGPSAGEAAISGRVTDAYGRAISSAAITVYDTLGTSRIVYTNTFGYYTMKDLDAGETYIVSVSARRHTFANPTIVVDLSDSVDGADFRASR